MILYVETNFLLEIAYEQETATACRTLMEVARDKGIDLVVPSYCIAEARSSLHRRLRERNRFSEELSKVIRELSRTSNYSDIRIRDAVLPALIEDGQRSETRLQVLIDEIYRVGVQIALNAEILLRAYGHQRRIGLGPEDAVVFASVVEDLKVRRPASSIFATRNSKDFLNPTVAYELEEMGCQLLTNFDEVVARVASGQDGGAQS